MNEYKTNFNSDNIDNLSLCCDYTEIIENNDIHEIHRYIPHSNMNLGPKEDCKPEIVYTSPKENTLEDLKSTLKDLKNYT